jgi:hypothetical protein
VAKTEEFLERLRSHEFAGRGDYEEQIERELRQLRRARTKEDSERIVNAICLKVTIACYALKAHERVSGREEPDGSGR